MASSRLILLVVMIAMGALGFSFRGFRARVGAALAGARAVILGEDPDEHYRLAERYYVAGDFEKADLSCRRVLELAPLHAPALELRQELRFVLSWSGGAATYDRYGSRAPALHSQTLHEIDRGLASGDSLLRAGEWPNAERQFRLVLEYAKWYPASVELDPLRERARVGLEACSFQD